jgi:hypothetical protein
LGDWLPLWSCKELRLFYRLQPSETLVRLFGNQANLRARLTCIGLSAHGDDALATIDPIVQSSINQSIIQPPNHQITYFTEIPAPMTTSVVRGLPGAPAKNGVPGAIA